MVKLIVSGCSYTDSRFSPEWPRKELSKLKAQGRTATFPSSDVWPKLLSKKLGMKCINLGQSGKGNEYIFSSILDRIQTEKDIGMVIAMWSEFQRYDFEKLPLKASLWDSLHLFRGTNKPSLDYVGKTLTENGMGTFQCNFYKSVRIFYTFQTVMESLKIPYMSIMGTDPAWHHEERMVIKTLLTSEYLDTIDYKRFIGWPIFDRIGGFCIDDKLSEWDSGERGNNSELRISDEDTHPNKEGHRRIAEYLYEEIKNGNLQTC